MLWAGGIGHYEKARQRPHRDGEQLRGQLGGVRAAHLDPAGLRQGVPGDDDALAWPATKAIATTTAAAPNSFNLLMMLVLEFHFQF